MAKNVHQDDLDLNPNICCMDSGASITASMYLGVWSFTPPNLGYEDLGKKDPYDGDTHSNKTIIKERKKKIYWKSIKSKDILHRNFFSFRFYPCLFFFIMSGYFYINLFLYAKEVKKKKN